MWLCVVRPPRDGQAHQVERCRHLRTVRLAAETVTVPISQLRTPPVSYRATESAWPGYSSGGGICGSMARSNTLTERGDQQPGGPNLPPPDSSLVANCVAVSPGAPTHVLLDDEVAEHIPGCNMAFRREALAAINGFDPVFRAAGDDVDLCWRLQNKGYKIGFSPAAVVWHFRRNTVRDYIKQQRGYGKAETLLFFKHPSRFNVLGQSRWFGRIYGDLSSFLANRQQRIYTGVFGRGLFQTLYQPPPSIISCLPLTLEWNLLSLLLFFCALVFGGGSGSDGAVRSHP